MIMTQILLVLDLLLSILVISPKLPIWFGQKKTSQGHLGKPSSWGAQGFLDCCNQLNFMNDLIA